MRCIFSLCAAQPALIDEQPSPWGDTSDDAPVRRIAEHELAWSGPGTVPSMQCPASLMSLPFTTSKRMALDGEAASLLRLARDRRKVAEEVIASGTLPTSTPLGGDGRPPLVAADQWSGRDLTGEAGVTFVASAGATGTGTGSGQVMSVADMRGVIDALIDQTMQAMAAAKVASDFYDTLSGHAFAVLETSTTLMDVPQVLASGREACDEAITRGALAIEKFETWKATL